MSTVWCRGILASTATQLYFVGVAVTCEWMVTGLKASQPLRVPPTLDEFSDAVDELQGVCQERLYERPVVVQLRRGAVDVMVPVVHRMVDDLLQPGEAASPVTCWTDSALCLIFLLRFFILAWGQSLLGSRSNMFAAAMVLLMEKWRPFQEAVEELPVGISPLLVRVPGEPVGQDGAQLVLPRLSVAVQ